MEKQVLSHPIRFRALLIGSGIVLVTLLWGGVSSPESEVHASVPTSNAVTRKISVPRNDNLPHFTQVREAAALFFVKKHVPEMLPFLDSLRKREPRRYRNEIRYIFQATELLAAIRNNPTRHDLELKIWITENKAQVLVARLASPRTSKNDAVLSQLRYLAKRLVRLDTQVLELEREQLKAQLRNVQRRISSARQSENFLIQKKYEQIFEPLATAQRQNKK